MSEKTPPTLLILGATSAVARAYIERKMDKGPINLILAGRDASKLTRIANDLKARGASSARVVAADIGSPNEVPAAMSSVASDGLPIDEALLAYGILGDQTDQQTNSVSLRSVIDVNYTSAAMWSELLATSFEGQGHGHLVVIGSVAGDRGRMSNYIYGSTKAALERLCEGMAHRFASHQDIHVTLVKPGFIDTPMTAHIEKGGPLWASPDKIAKVIDDAVEKKRVRVYAPWFWRHILRVIRALPIPIMHKTKM